MIKDKSYSAYILPIRCGDVAMLDYGGGNYGPIGGRLDENEDFIGALRRELMEELGETSLKLLESIKEIPVPYSFKHTTIERAEKRGAWSEEHHYFISQNTDSIDLKFCEKRDEDISVKWLKISDLVNPDIIKFDDMREFFAENLLPNIK